MVPKKTPKLIFEKVKKNYNHKIFNKKMENRAFSSKMKKLEFFADFQIEILKMDIKSMSDFEKSIQELEKSCY